MKGFKSVNKNIDENIIGSIEILNEKRVRGENISHAVALENGLEVDRENDVYVHPELGAFLANVSSNINSVEDLRKAYDEVLKCNPFHGIVKMMDKGYEIWVGPSFPLKNGKISSYLIGLYCPNYLEMAEKEVSNEVNV